MVFHKKWVRAVLVSEGIFRKASPAPETAWSAELKGESVETWGANRHTLADN